METIKQVCDPTRTQRILSNYLTYKNLDEQELQEKTNNETEEGYYNAEKRENIIYVTNSSPGDCDSDTSLEQLHKRQELSSFI